MLKNFTQGVLGIVDAKHIEFQQVYRMGKAKVGNWGVKNPAKKCSMKSQHSPMILKWKEKKRKRKYTLKQIDKGKAKG